MIVSQDGKGGGGFVSPYTGEVFTSRFAFNDHMARWPAIAAENGLNLDGRPQGPAKPTESPSGAQATQSKAAKGKGKTRK